MVYKGNPIKMDDLGVPLFLETPIYQSHGSVMGTGKANTLQTNIAGWKIQPFFEIRISGFGKRWVSIQQNVRDDYRW